MFYHHLLVSNESALQVLTVQLLRKPVLLFYEATEMLQEDMQRCNLENHLCVFLQ